MQLVTTLAFSFDRIVIARPMVATVEGWLYRYKLGEECAWCVVTPHLSVECAHVPNIVVITFIFTKNGTNKLLIKLYTNTHYKLKSQMN